MSSITITLFDDAAAKIKNVIHSPRSTDSDDEERMAPFTTSPLENCFCISSAQISHMKVRDGRKKDKEGKEGKSNIKIKEYKNGNKKVRNAQ